MKQVLIVDDSKFMRKILKTTLGGGGSYVFSEASSGKEALNFLKNQKFDLIILDIVMEDNGLDILKQILNIDKKAKVIMVSAVNQELAIENSIKIGAKAYITKPFNESEIISTIEKVLQQN